MRTLCWRVEVLGKGFRKPREEKHLGNGHTGSWRRARLA